MKIRVLAFCLLASAFCLQAAGQSYSIDWYTIGGGGGTSTGGVYTVSGTIGQPDAGAMSGGNYSLTGGFWSLIAIQTPGAPLLSVAPASPGLVLISWPSPATGFVLQTNSNLATTNWVNFGGTVYDDGTVKRVTNSPPVGNLFFRLKK